jgi:hypothetical protein
MRERLASTYLKTLPNWRDSTKRCKLSTAFILTGSRVPGIFRSDAALSTKASRVTKSRPSPDCLSLSQITLHLPFLHHNDAWAQCTLAVASWHKALYSYSTRCKETLSCLVEMYAYLQFLSPSFLLFLLPFFTLRCVFIYLSFVKRLTASYGVINEE